MADTTPSSTPTRCQPGDRARIISAQIPQNIGKVVVVVSPYLKNDIIAGSLWKTNGPAWVVTSLGAPLASFQVSTGDVKTRCMTIVLEDARLMPLRDDEGGIEDSVARDLEVTR